MRRFEDFPLGAADSSIIAVAERLKIREIASIDGHSRAGQAPRDLGRGQPADSGRALDGFNRDTVSERCQCPDVARVGGHYDTSRLSSSNHDRIDG